MDVTGIRVKIDGSDKAQRDADHLAGSLERLGKSGTRVEDGFDRLKSSLMKLGGAFIGLEMAQRAAQAFIDTLLQVEALEGRIGAAVGGVALARDALRFVSDEADRLGLTFASAAQGFGTLSAAAMGTSLTTAELRNTFLGVSEAAAAMRLSADDVNSALIALGQVISKGKVQAEELRGQLGERIPGAFQIAARAMNVTTQELDKMLEQGKVYAEDFLPKFGAELRKTFGQGAADAASGLRAELNRLQTAWMGIVDALKDAGVADTLAKAVRVVQDALEGLEQVIRSGVIQDFFQAHFAEPFVKRFEQIDKAFQNLTGITLAEFGKKVADAIASASDVVMAFIGDLPKNAGKALDFVVGAFRYGWQAVSDGALILGSHVEETFTAIGLWAQVAANAVKGWFLSAWDAVISGAAGMLTWLGSALSGMGLESAAGQLMTAASSVRDFSGGAKDATDALKGLGQQIADNAAGHESYRSTLMTAMNESQEAIARQTQAAIAQTEADALARDKRFVALQAERGALAQAQEQADRYALATVALNEKTDKSTDTAKAAAGAAAKLAEKWKEYVIESELAVASTEKLAAAYEQGSVAVANAVIEQEAEKDVLTFGASKRTEIIGLLTKEAQARAKLDIAQTVADLKTETDLLRREAEAMAAGEKALEEFNIQREAETIIRESNIELLGTEADAYKDTVEQQVRAKVEAEKHVDVQEKLKDLIEDTRTPAERYRATIEQLAADYREAAASGKLTAEAIDAFARKAQQARDDLLGLPSAGEAMEEALLNGVRRLDDAFANLWTGLLDGSLNAFDAIKKAFMQMLAEMLHAAITRPIVLQISAAMGLTGAAGGAQAGGFGGGGGLDWMGLARGGYNWLTGGVGMGAAGNMAALGEVGTGAVYNFTGPVELSGWPGAGAAGMPNWAYGIAGLGGGLFGGWAGDAMFGNPEAATGGGIGGSLGATAGLALGAGTASAAAGTMGAAYYAALGAAAGPIGAVIGAVLGALLGSVLGNLMADKTDPRIALASNEAGGNYEDDISVKSPFGTLGFRSASHGVKAEESKPLLDLLAGVDAMVASLMTPEEVNRATAALADFKQELIDLEDMEPNDLARQAADRLEKVWDVLDVEVADMGRRLLEGFDGTIEHLATMVGGLVQVQTALNQGTISTLDWVGPRFEAAAKQWEGSAESLAAFTSGLIAMQQALDLGVISTLDRIGPLFDAVTENWTGTAEELLAYTNALIGLQAFLDFDPYKTYQEALEAAGKSSHDVAMDQADALRDLIAGFDGSVEATIRLSQATAQFAQSAVQAIADIEAARANIGQGIAGAQEQILLQTLDPAAQIEYFRAQFERLTTQIAQSTNAEEIARLTSQAIAYETRVFGMLSPEDQRAQLGDFQTSLSQLETWSTARLDDLASGVTAAVAQSQATTQEALGNAADRIAAAADTLTKAAALQQESATTTAQSVIVLRDGSLAIDSAAARFEAAAQTPQEVRIVVADSSMREIGTFSR